MSAPDVVRVASWSETPGLRKRSDGPDSAEEFYEDVLRPRLDAAVGSGVALVLNLDGGIGFSAAFLDELAQRIAADYPPDLVADPLFSVTSDEEPYLVDHFRQILATYQHGAAEVIQKYRDAGAAERGSVFALAPTWPGRGLTIAFGQSGGFFFLNRDSFWHLGLGRIGVTWWRLDAEKLFTYLLAS